MKAPQQRHAFTLVELLVVIGVISILAGLLLPAITGATAQAKMAACINNLQQVSRAIITYSGNYGFQFPSPAHTDTPEDDQGQLNGHEYWDGHKVADEYVSYTWKGKLYAFIGGRGDMSEEDIYKVLKCPSVRRFVCTEPGCEGHKSFYGTNAYVTMHYGLEDGTAEELLRYEKKKTLHFDQIESPSTTFMVGENNTGHWAVRPETARKETDFTTATEEAIIYTRHENKSAWVFFDGSAKPLDKAESQSRKCQQWFGIKRLAEQ
ncbi:type II secretion system protein [bacterium]|nr:type II secretion system protein [bacterium]